MLKRKPIKLLLAALMLLVVPLALTGCTLPSGWLGATTATNSKDTGYFKKVIVTYNNKRDTYQNVKVYPYNNGGDDSTGGKLEIRAHNRVIVLPDDAQVELYK